MGTVEMIIRFHMRALVLFLWLFVPSLGKDLLSCEATSPDASGYPCNENGTQSYCGTFALFLTNSYYSSLSNLTLYLGLNRFVIAETNGFSAETEFLSHDQPLLIPIDCKCKGGFFQAELTKTSIKGESFYGIAQTLKGLTTCKAIRNNNPASKFNVTQEAIVSANNISSEGLRARNLAPFTSILIPLNDKPILGPLAKPKEPNSGFPTTRIPDTLDGKIIDATPRKMLLETYTIEDMRKATEDFSSSSLIEGSVFYGRINGKNMAIKRTKTEMVSKIDLGLFHDALHNHPNILRLLGTSLLEGPESFLVFEYAKNGSLKDWLHGGLAIKNQFIASCYCFLNWSQRLRICLDVASALQYMHHVMNPSYVHRNVKSRNIFLDEEFGAKIGNFGMAGCVENDTEDPHFYSTNPASWSLGYLAPEYVHQGIISPSIDIFAYGVVLLEVLSGQTPISRPNDKGEGSIWLTDKIKTILMSENVNELREWIDSALGENYSFDAAVTVANIARACVEEDSSLRPSAREIVEKLSRLVEELPEGEQHMLMSESSSKPLVEAIVSNL
ncbi:Protein kinase domain [Sesbania bispinosa]|nr:Protein kinase domain [Sesbania bispinosa]